MLNLNVHSTTNQNLYIEGIISPEFLGKDILLTEESGQKFVFKIIPVIDSSFSTKKPKPTFGSAKGQIVMSDDFDEPLAEFADYMPPIK